MATNSFLLNPFTGAPAKVNVTLTDNGSNQVEVKLDVVSGYIADIVGFFANFNNGLTVNQNFSIDPNTLSSSPNAITGVATTSPDFKKLYLDDSGSTIDGIEALDNDVNLNGGGDQRTYQLGVQIGKGGKGQEDDYQSVTFNLLAPGLDVSDFSKIGIRLQSVGADSNGNGTIEEGERGGSSKLEGEVPKTFNISGTKYLDQTGDGIITGDPGLGGVEIFIDKNKSGSYDEGELKTTTATDGTWSFNNLGQDALGKKVYEILPDGYTQTVGNDGYTLPTVGGQNQTGLNFANFKLFNISGTKYLDQTGDKISSDDTGLAGINIFIDKNENGSYDEGELKTTTATDGTWSFNNLGQDALGRKVYEILPDGYTQTVGNDGYTLPTVGGQNQTGLNFANFKLFNISGTKYRDKKGDGITTDDTGLGGVEIFIDKNKSGSYDEGELKTTTATDGTWSFNNLGQDALGKKVYEILPDGYTQTVGNDGYTLPTVGGQNQTGLNFANFKLFNISGTKYLDQTGDKISSDDTGLAGINIFIDKNENGSYDEGELETTTATDGTWSFNNLGQDALGKKVYEILPDGYTQTVGNDGYTLPTVGGQNQTGLNFANFKLFNISGTKYRDKKGDGITTDDTGLGGVEIFIDKNKSGSYDEGELKTTTATDGTWSFNNLGQDALGKKVYEILPDGYTQTVGNDGYTLPTVGGQNQTGLNFANFKLFNISGTKYRDKKGDGITTDDTGLGGVEIFIDKNNNGSYDDGDDVKTTTATNGTWSFSNLGQDALGKKVYEILPSGYTQTVGNDGYLLQGKDQTGLNFANFKPYGLGKTPGFWKQSQHFQYWPKYIEGENQGKFVYNTTDKFSTTFGVGTTDGGLFKYPTDNSGVKWFTDSLIGALSAEGSTGAGAVKTYGNISALGRSATAALLNATSDELNNYVKGSNINYIIDEDLLSPNDRTFLSTKVDGIFDIDGSRIGPADGIISSQEVINAVKDVFTIGGGLYGALDVNTLATAFDKMNNMGGG
ncbi:hypothetical protein NO976_03442 [Planktothrix agardhii]|uniref:hypothetical protein n=1 Tax=Planktothrix agardhii TaxID=1160 RepID=UPI0020A7FCA8|nr:hypothetical protein [Planktothrix agardhii]CAD5963658.1 hypothetical protein NO976_03442 [Planktothrix agardhii]